VLRPRLTPEGAAWSAGLLVGAVAATAAWVRLAGHPPVAVSRAQLAAIRACIRALEALPAREWDDDALEWPYKASGSDSAGLRSRPGLSVSPPPAPGAYELFRRGVATYANGGYVTPADPHRDTVRGIIHPGEWRVSAADVKRHGAYFLPEVKRRLDLGEEE